MECKVVGITFRTKENPEVGTLKPQGSVVLKQEKDNPKDHNAIGVYYQGIKVGFIPVGFEQVKINKAFDNGYEVKAEVKEYRYLDGEEWNNEDKGVLQYILLDIHSSNPEAKKEEEAFRRVMERRILKEQPTKNLEDGSPF